MPWRIVACEELPPTRDALLLRYVVERGDGERRDVLVELTGTVAATAPDTLPSPLDDIVRTRGRSVIEAGARRIEPVARITINSNRFDVFPRHGAYEPGDRVYVYDDGHWLPAEILQTPASLHEAGAPPVVVTVDFPGAPEPVRRDAVVVMRDGDHQIETHPFERVRPFPPATA